MPGLVELATAVMQAAHEGDERSAVDGVARLAEEVRRARVYYERRLEEVRPSLQNASTPGFKP
jgi:hypothetical protein